MNSYELDHLAKLVLTELNDLLDELYPNDESYHHTVSLQHASRRRLADRILRALEREDLYLVRRQLDPPSIVEEAEDTPLEIPPDIARMLRQTPRPTRPERAQIPSDPMTTITTQDLGHTWRAEHDLESPGALRCATCWMRSDWPGAKQPCANRSGLNRRALAGTNSSHPTKGKPRAPTDTDSDDESELEHAETAQHDE